ncbi:MAG: hypothetical protein WC028_12300 [Candidatus Obscuribacterales bacterium]
MKTIIFQNNGHSKVIHGRFGGCEESRHFHCCDRPSRPQIAQKILANEARLEIAECKGNPQVFDADLPHPHDLGLPSLSLVRARLADGDVRCGITEVLHGALGVAQFGNNRIAFEVPASGRNGGGSSSRSRGRRRLVLNVRTNEQGFITAAHYG